MGLRIHGITDIRVDMAIPLKQGLKHVTIIFYHFLLDVDMAIPLKQGLKHLIYHKAPPFSLR